MVTLDYLIPDLRLRIGDIDSTKYRYADEWLTASLIGAVKTSYRYFGNKYSVDDYGSVSRNPKYLYFEFDISEGEVEKRDEPILVLLAAIIILEGSLENSAWNIGSWKDNEVSVSNIKSGELRENTLKRIQDELDALILPPTKRLARARKASLPGYINNTNEREGLY